MLHLTKQRSREWSVEADLRDSLCISGSDHIASRPTDSLTELLKTLSSHSCFSDLPRSARALLSTPRAAESVRVMDVGQYCHFSLAEGLYSALRGVACIADPLVIDVNVDGLHLTKSTR